MTTPVLVQSNIGTVSGTSLGVAFSSAVTSGNTIIAFGSSTSTAATLNFTDNVNTGRYARDNAGAAGGFTLLVGRFAATANGTPTVTMTSNLSSTLGLIIQEWSGFDGLIPFEQGTNPVNGSSTAPSAGATATLAETGELVLAFARLGVSAQTWTAGSGFTLDPNISGSIRGGMVEYQVVFGTSPVTGAFTVTGSAQAWTACNTVYRSAKTRTQIALTTPGTGTFSAPADWPGIADKAEVIGGGGAGHAAGTHEGLGGGGGAYTYINALVLNNGDSLQVGAAGVSSGAGGTASWLKTTGTLFADFGRGAAAGAPGGGGGAASCVPSANAFSGGSGGAFANSATAGASGGGGAAGPWGPGGVGGTQFATGTTGGTGGGGGEGNNGVNQTASNQAGTAGGNAGNFSGFQAGTGGAGGASGLNAGSPGTAATPNGGGAGGGGGGSDGAGGGGAGGNGGAGVDWLINSVSYGAGGGGGGTGQQNSGSSPSAGAGGLYGGGGGGGGNGTATMFGAGGKGIIVITYTPIQVSQTPILYTRRYVLFNT